jgi:hypothetical protein
MKARVWEHAHGVASRHFKETTKKFDVLHHRNLLPSAQLRGQFLEPDSPVPEDFLS